MSIYFNPSVNWSRSRRRASLRSSHEVGVGEGGEGDHERFECKTLTLDLYESRSTIRVEQEMLEESSVVLWGFRLAMVLGKLTIVIGAGMVLSLTRGI